MLPIARAADLSLDAQIIACVRALTTALQPSHSDRLPDLAELPPSPPGLLAELGQAIPEEIKLSHSSALEQAFFLVESYGQILAESSREDQHKRGAFLTPAALARSLVPKVFQQKSWQPGERLCDPTMGGGVFLLSALEALENSGHSRESILPCLFGVDQSPVAVEVTRLAFSLFGAPANALREQFQLGNALAPAQHPRCPKVLRDGFSFVLGNPPWLSFSGRHKEALSEETRELLQLYEAPDSQGRVWPSLHGPFLQRMAQLTHEDGCLGVLFPAQVTDLEGYFGTRQKLEERLGAPAILIDLGEDAFPGVVSPSVFGIFHRESSPSEVQGTEVWRYGGDSLGARLEKALSGHGLFPEDCFGDIGVHTGNVSKQVIFKNLKYFPIREGKQISPFALAPAQKSVRLGAKLPKGSYWRHRDLETYQSVAILIRQTAKRPLAARHTEPSYFRNSALACFGVPGWPLEVILALLNSEILGTLHQQRFRDARQQSFPQVKIAQLRSYPLPQKERLSRPWSSSQNLGDFLCEEVRRLEEDPSRAPEILEDVERAIGRLYGLSDKVVEEIVAKVRQRWGC